MLLKMEYNSVIYYTDDHKCFKILIDEDYDVIFSIIDTLTQDCIYSCTWEEYLEEYGNKQEYLREKLIAYISKYYDKEKDKAIFFINKKEEN
jgi:hypothetical protein